MMDYFRDGGFSMWLILVTAIGALAYAVAGPSHQRSKVLAAGVVALLAEGQLGMATGMVMVSRHYGRFPDKTDAIAQGLGELSNNGTFSVTMALLLGVGWLLSLRGGTKPAS